MIDSYADDKISTGDKNFQGKSRLESSVSLNRKIVITTLLQLQVYKSRNLMKNVDAPKGLRYKNTGTESELHI